MPMPRKITMKGDDARYTERRNAQLPDDGREILMYKDGKRVEDTSDEMLPRAQHLQIVIRDINELEKRIRKTSLEIQKYQKRLQ